MKLSLVMTSRQPCYWLMVAQQTDAQVIKLPLNDRRLPDVERLRN